MGTKSKLESRQDYLEEIADSIRNIRRPITSEGRFVPLKDELPKQKKSKPFWEK